MANKFYPTLATLIQTDDIPNELDFIKDGIVSIFSTLYFKDFQFTKSKHGDSAFYSLTLVSLQGESLGDAASGFALLLNPSDVGTTSEYPITLEYNWPIIRYLKEFDLSTFTGSGQEIFDIILEIIGVTKEELFEEALKIFKAQITGGSGLSSGFGKQDVDALIDDINGAYPLTGLDIIGYSASTDPKTALLELISDIASNAFFISFSISPVNVLYTVLLDDLDFDQLKANIEVLMIKWLDNAAEFLLDLIIPKVKFTSEFEIGLQFPRTILLPLDGAGDPIDAPEKSMFTVGPATFGFSTENGLEYNLDVAGDLNHPSQIGNTGFTFDISNVKLDFSPVNNIPEADAEDRPNTFKGIFIETVTIGLPKTLTPESGQTTYIKGSNLLIGTEGGFSGVLSLEGASLRAEIASLTIELNTFGIEFYQNAVTAFDIKADLFIPGVKATSAGVNSLGQTYAIGDPGPIALDISYATPDYTIAVTSNPAFDIFGIELVVDDLQLSFDTTSINTFEFKGELLIPNLKAKGAGSNPSGSFADGDPAPIYFETTYLDSGVDKTFTVSASSIPQINILGLGIEIDSLEFDILNGSLDGFVVESFIFLPGVEAETSGTYGTSGTYLPGDLAPIGLNVSYNDPDYAMSLDSVPAIKIFGMELEIFTFNLDFDNTSINNFELVSEIKIPNLLVKDGEGGGTTTNGTLIVEGEPAPIGLSATYSGGASDIFSFSASAIPQFNLFGLDVTIPSIGFSIVDGALSALSFSAQIDLGLSGGTIGVQFSYSGGVYTIGMTAAVPLTLGSVVFNFSSFDLTFDSSGILSTNITGTMIVDGHNINFEMGFSNDGWAITAEDLGGVGFTIPNVLGVTIYALTIGKRNGNFFVEIGKPSNMDLGDDTLGAALENLLTIPFVGKYLPSQLDIGFLSFEQGSGMDLDNAELKLLWPELEGLTISSTDSGLEAVIPINKTIFKTITINTLTVSMSNVDTNGNGEDETVLKALMDGTLEIGPVLGTVSGVGLKATISYPSGGGNLGAANIDEFKIDGPDGIGLSIDTAGIKGGGFLTFDKEKGEYAGFLGLTIQDKISLNAIAILNTKFPDGSTGISLLVILTAEFNPGIQLGFGFNLSGLGGLFGLHRTMEVEPLRLGVKNGTIDHILFPDPTTFVQNASMHLSNIKAIFPVDHGRFVFGPMAKIGWGAPTLITAEVGLLLEVPKPIRLAILGVIKAVLPDEDNDLIRLQINFLGLIDFGKKFISFDATIFDSKILTFAISGDMAFRLNYGDTPAFLLSVGGFHPKFNSPLPVPAMNRLMVKIVDTAKIKVSLSTYFAVTSNTVQFGAKIDLQANIGSISAKGYFGLDTLFQFAPFYMIASISAGIAISYKNFDLAAIYLSGELEGPTPWKVKGTATFKIIGIEKSFNMSETFGQEKTITYESVDVENLVVKALDDNTNWQVVTSNLQDNNVVMKAQFDSTSIISASGTLSITQRVVPLNYTIQKYGNRVPSGANTFAIASVAFGSGTTVLADLENLKEDFASAEYKNIDKSKKLSIPSFEKMDGGVKVNPPSGGLGYGGNSVVTVSNQRDALYEKTLIDFVPTIPDPTILEVKYDHSMYPLEENWMQREVRGGAAAKSAASRTKTRLYGKSDQRVSVQEETYAVVSTSDLTTTHSAKTRLEAEELMEMAILNDPTLEGQLQIITNHLTI